MVPALRSSARAPHRVRDTELLVAQTEVFTSK